MSRVRALQIYAEAIANLYGCTVRPAPTESSPRRAPIADPSGQVGNSPQPVNGLSRGDCNTPARASRQFSEGMEHAP